MSSPSCTLFLAASSLSFLDSWTPRWPLPSAGTVSYPPSDAHIPDVFQWAVTLPLELTVAGSTVMYWKNDVPLAAWYTIFYLIVLVRAFLSKD